MDMTSQDSQDIKVENNVSLMDDDIEEYTSSIIKALDLQDDVHDAVYNAIQVTSRRGNNNRPRCDACGGAHNTDRCRSRELDFLPASICKQVEQINLQRGDKPKVPIPDIPLSPSPSTTQNNQRSVNQYGTMAAIDYDDVDVNYEALADVIK